MKNIKETQQFKKILSQIRYLEGIVIRECAAVLKRYNIQEYKIKIDPDPQNYNGGMLSLKLKNMSQDNIGIFNSYNPNHNVYNYDSISDYVYQWYGQLNIKRFLKLLIKIPYILKSDIIWDNKAYINKLKKIDKTVNLLQTKYTINMLTRYYKKLHR